MYAYRFGKHFRKVFGARNRFLGASTRGKCILGLNLWQKTFESEVSLMIVNDEQLHILGLSA